MFLLSACHIVAPSQEKSGVTILLLFYISITNDFHTLVKNPLCPRRDTEEQSGEGGLTYLPHIQLLWLGDAGLICLVNDFYKHSKDGGGRVAILVPLLI